MAGDSFVRALGHEVRTNPREFLFFFVILENIKGGNEVSENTSQRSSFGGEFREGKG